MAESSAQDKLLLVQALRKGGKVVAVTGYATDDAHALHEVNLRAFGYVIYFSFGQMIKMTPGVWVAFHQAGLF